ncbi:MAG: hypothetical protein KW788_00710 [Candidatus Doudnabacteria bacterium]|nr:hypothetical protein [Candidatus Doudnabacteria bacterium]
MDLRKWAWIYIAMILVPELLWARFLGLILPASWLHPYTWIPLVPKFYSFQGSGLPFTYFMITLEIIGLVGLLTLIFRKKQY